MPLAPCYQSKRGLLGYRGSEDQRPAYISIIESRGHADPPLSGSDQELLEICKSRTRMLVAT